MGSICDKYKTKPSNINEIYNQDKINKNSVNVINIIHFNDVENLEEQEDEPKGGLARFFTAVNYWKNKLDGETIILFSGDLYSPSKLTTV